MSINKPITRMLKGFVILNIELEIRTGLLIRMPISVQAYRIGGADAYPMITKKKYRLDQSNEVELEVPYIPGSSFKGRMRGLLELAFGKRLYTTDYKIWYHVRNLSAKAMSIDEFVSDVEERCLVDELFGYAAVNFDQIRSEYYEKFVEELKKKGYNEAKAKEEAKSIAENSTYNVFINLAQTRLLVDDFYPAEDYIKNVRAKSIGDFLEEKPENRIDRVTAAADPRDIVRVKPSVRFGGRITLLIFDNDSDMIKGYLTTIATGFKLIEETYLGSSGSRGYGRVKFVGIDVNVSKVQIENNVPKLVLPEKEGLRRKYMSVDEFEENVENLAEEIKKYLFG